MRMLAVFVGVLIACGRPPPAPDLELAALLDADPEYSRWNTSGDRAEGVACSADYQCASDRCSSDGGAICGVCLAHRRLGESCGAPYEACSRSAVCIGGVCETTQIGLGGPCERGPKGGDGCDIELTCATSGKCVRPLPLGAACTDAVACRVGLSCGSDQRCVEPRTTGAPIVSCDAATPCSGAQACDTNGRCRDSVVPLGAPCSVGGGPLCVFGTACAGEPRICTALPTEGQPAIYGFACAPGLFADSSAAHLCAPQRGQHAFCAHDGWCAAGLECRRGACEKPCG